jgi:thymidylate synthase (FAD)
MNEIISGIAYSKPKVALLQEAGIGTAEIAARTCYDSFDLSENECVKDFNKDPHIGLISSVNSISHSELLDTLAWTHFHHSILEHASLTYLIRGTSRGVLQEIVRHRIASYSVRSTRYTMSSIINAFVASWADSNTDAKEWFIDKLLTFDLFITSDIEYNKLEISSIFDKLNYQLDITPKTGSIDEPYDFFKVAVAKSSLYLLDESRTCDRMFEALELGKKKRNVGDAFKHIVTDNWKVDMVATFNLRSLKNFFELRDSGAAWFQIRWLAQAMKEVTTSKYLDLIIKRNKNV